MGSDNIDIDLSTICRLCLCDGSDSVDIFDKEDKTSLTLRIMACASLEVQESDALPKNICTKCRIHLEESYLFRKRCQISDKKLKRHIRLINAGKHSEGLEFDEDDLEELEESINFLDTVKLDNKEEADKKVMERAKKIADLEIKKHLQELHEKKQIADQSVDRLTYNDASSQTDDIENLEDTIDSDTQIEVIEYDEFIHGHTDEDEEFVDIKAVHDGANISSAEESTGQTYYIDYINGTDSVKPSITGIFAAEKDIKMEGELCEEDYLDESDSQCNEVLQSSGEEDVLTTSTVTKSTRKDSGLKVFKCTECTEKFSRRYQLINHESQHKKPKTGCHLCKYCSRNFANSSSLTRHIRTHTGEKPFTCPICSKAFNQNEILARHIHTHDKTNSFKCHKCDKSFTQKTLLKGHIKRTHEKIQEMQKCPLCTKQFAHSSGLSRHLLIHGGFKNDCGICGRSFNDKSALKRHERTQHIYTQYPCKVR